MKAELIFATASPQRKAICRRHGIKCTFSKSMAREGLGGASARAVAISNALRKARAIGTGEKQIAIGADTVVALGRRIIGKPKNAADARRIIGMLSGKMHRVITGVCIVSKKRKKCYCDESQVWFKELDEGKISRYISSGKWKGKAGGYGVQSDSRMLIAKIKGSRENVEGLDGKRLEKELGAFISRP